MKVNELISMLEDCNPDYDVYFTYDYGDHSHTMAAEPVEEVNYEMITFSAYTETMKVIDGYEADEDDDETVTEEVICLR